VPPCSSRGGRCWSAAEKGLSSGFLCDLCVSREAPLVSVAAEPRRASCGHSSFFPVSDVTPTLDAARRYSVAFFCCGLSFNRTRAFVHNVPTNDASFLFGSALTRAWKRLALLALLGFGVYLALHFALVAGGADSSGYLNSAKALAEGRLTDPIRAVPEIEGRTWLFVPMGYWGEQDRNFVVPTYPPGLPLIFAASSFAGDWYWGPLLACVLGAVAAVWLCFLCAREAGVSTPLAVAGAVSLALSTMFLFSALQPMSDLLATTGCLAAVWAAQRACRTGAPWWALACGAIFGLGVLVRPSNIVLLPALVLLLWNWRRLLWAALGGLPFAVFLAIYQNALYGHPLRSGYGSIQSMFHADLFARTIAHYATWMPRLLPLAVLVVPLAFLLPWRTRGREIAAMVAWFVAVFGFYAFYFCTHESWWYLRFVLPAFPALIVLALLGLDGAIARLRAWQKVARLAAAVALTGVALGFSVRENSAQGIFGAQADQFAYADVCGWANANCPPGSLIVCMQGSGAVFFYTRFPILRWDNVKPAEFAEHARRLRAAGRPVYALIEEWEQERAFRDHAVERWEQVTAIGGFRVWRLAP
jgi:hypothetical protein